MNFILSSMFALGLALDPSPKGMGPTPGSLDMKWDAGTKDGKPHAHTPIEVRSYDGRTFVLRENLADTWEAPFMYLLIGTKRALLIDTGDVADPETMPLERTVMALLPGGGQSKMPLLVLHSHGHQDHHMGDPQFENHPLVQVVPPDLAHIRAYFSFSNWPNETASVDLGDRIIDVLPAPGHHPAQVVFYDRGTGILLTGDFLLPGRVLVDDIRAYRASAERVAQFVKDRPVTCVFGGHVEKNRAGELYPWGSSYHPDERPLSLTKADVMLLPSALAEFNGFYTETGEFVIENPMRNLIVGTAAVLPALSLAGVGLYRVIRRRRKRT